MKPLSQRTLERIPKISWLFLARVFAILMHIYVFSYCIFSAQASFILVLLVLKTKTVVIQYLALKLIATYRVLQ